QEYVAAGEYKFISPVILYKKGSGRIVGLHSAALTNTACIDGMDDLLSLAAASFSLEEATTTQESLTMNIEELLEQLRWLLNLPTLATAEEISAELQKAVAKIKEAPAAAAAGFSLTGYIAELQTQMAALSAATPDPAKFVSVDAMAALQTQVAALTAEKIDREVDGVVTAALASGKILPPQEKWARELGKTNMAALNQYLESVQPVAALAGTQTKGAAPAGKPEGALTDAELAMCSALGVSEEDFRKTKAAAQA
ncbi:MAG: phage protease, partial [Pseudomonadota bacterium]